MGQCMARRAKEIDMTDSIEFYYDQFGTPDFRVADDHYFNLGAWLTGDIQSYAPDCLELLATVEDLRAGRTPMEDWEGNAYHVRMTAGDVVLVNLHVPDQATTYSVDDTHAALLSYWNFLTSDPADKVRFLRDWEKDAGRTHPCHAHLE